MIVLSIDLYFEALSLMVALISYERLKNSFMLLFIPFLGITLFSELSSAYIYQTYAASTTWIYKILNPLTQCFYAYIFYNFFIKSVHKKITRALVGAYCLFILLIYSLDKAFNSYTIVLGGVTQIFLAFGYFYQCLENDDYLHSPKWASGLWIASGILIFYSGITICFSLYDYIRINKLQIGGISLYNLIPRYLSVILYTCLSVSFLTWKAPQKIL